MSRESKVDEIMRAQRGNRPEGVSSESLTTIRLLAELVRAVDHLSDSIEYQAVEIAKILDR